MIIFTVFLSIYIVCICADVRIPFSGCLITMDSYHVYSLLAESVPPPPNVNEPMLYVCNVHGSIVRMTVVSTSSVASIVMPVILHKEQKVSPQMPFSHLRTLKLTNCCFVAVSSFLVYEIRHF